MTEPRYPYVHVDVPAELADEVSALLWDLGAQGLEERDESTLLKGEAGSTTLVASFADETLAGEALCELDDAWNPRIEYVIGDAWRDEWKKHYHPFLLCEGVGVRPPWEPWGDLPADHVLELEPGRAFGTGLHESTSMVSELIGAHRDEVRGKPVLDLGCGSGILSFVALVLGATHATTEDLDADVLPVVVENAERNSLQGRLTTRAAGVADGGIKAPVVFANIEASVLLPFAEPILDRVEPGGLLMLSGLLAFQRDDILKAYAKASLVDERSRGEWIALVFRTAQA
jgi:ribosomal protein L11 methyltransferase